MVKKFLILGSCFVIVLLINDGNVLLIWVNNVFGKLIKWWCFLDLIKFINVLVIFLGGFMVLFNFLFIVCICGELIVVLVVWGVKYNIFILLWLSFLVRVLVIFLRLNLLV